MRWRNDTASGWTKSATSSPPAISSRSAGTSASLHGHNYRVQVEVDGPLDENHYVVDFIALAAPEGHYRELDHRMMLPTEHREIRVLADEREVAVTFEDRRWVFPRCDCVLLPLPNTTAELLARTSADDCWTPCKPKRAFGPNGCRWRRRRQRTVGDLGIDEG